LYFADAAGNSVQSGNWNAVSTWNFFTATNLDGTITTTNGNTLVNGSGGGGGTHFCHNLSPGDIITRSDGTVIGTVASITNNNSLQLTAGGALSTNTNITYRKRRIPDSGDDVTISSGHVVTVTANASCNSLAVNNSGATTGVTINGSNALTVTSSVTINAPTANATSTIAVGSGTLSGTALNITSGNSNRISEVTVGNNGLVDIAGSVTFSGTTSSARFTFSGTGSLEVDDDFGSGGTLASVAGSTIRFTGTALSTMGIYTTYPDVEINKASGSVNYGWDDYNKWNT
jgi:hypothetical protein